MSRKIPPNTNPCRRVYLYRGQLLDCDSNLSLDGERLRPIIQRVPEAVTELNVYQSNRRFVNKLAYTGSAGIVLMLAGFLVGRQVGGGTGILLRNIGYAGGLVLTGGSLIYGVSLLTTNEQHLGEAVRHYNAAYPNDPIELQFTTGINF